MVFTKSWKYKLNRRQAYSLLHRGAGALAKASYAGIAVDEAYCRKQQAYCQEQATAIEEQEIWSTDVGKEWKAKHGKAASIESASQVSWILFEVLGCTPVKRTASEESWSVDKDSLNQVDHPLASTILDVRKYRAMGDTFLAQILRETQDGFVHPNFNLHNVITYRSSSSAINFQAQPIRDLIMGAIVRGAFRPRPGRVLIEIDFKQLEVSISCCYHMDPAMVRYLKGEGDMHLDAACDAYLLQAAQVNKLTRYAAKNRFVFPEFYGSWYEQVALSLWKAIREFKLTIKDSDVTVMSHIAALLEFPHNEMTLGLARRQLAAVDLPASWPQQSASTFTADQCAYLLFRNHIKEVEHRFWFERFPVYRQWKDDWYAEYQRTGVVPYLTGFECASADFSKNDVTNYPVQGSAFHCLLKVFCDMGDEIERSKLDAILIGQIHDSALADVAAEAVPDFLDLAVDYATRKLPQDWPWIMVPVKIEAEACQPDEPWSKKKEVELPELKVV